MPVSILMQHILEDENQSKLRGSKKKATIKIGEPGYWENYARKFAQKMVDGAKRIRKYIIQPVETLGETKN